MVARGYIIYPGRVKPYSGCMKGCRKKLSCLVTCMSKWHVGPQTHHHPEWANAICYDTRAHKRTMHPSVLAQQSRLILADADHSHNTCKNLTSFSQKIYTHVQIQADMREPNTPYFWWWKGITLHVLLYMLRTVPFLKQINMSRKVLKNFISC